jgi:peptidyl-prolyl cis-trans isomerase C
MQGAAAQQPPAKPAVAAPATPDKPAPDAKTAQPAQVNQPAQVKAAPDPDKVLARVNGTPITQRDLDVAAEDMADRLPRVPEDQKRDYLLSYLIDLTIGSQAAAEAKIGETPDFARKLSYNRNKLLLDEYLAQEAKKAATPEAARKMYEQTVKDVKPQEEVRARHILVDSDDLAKKAYAKIKAGEDFKKVAAELSKDPGSAKDGGELGWFTKDQMVPEFAEVAFKLKPGDVSEPVKSPFGWHVIEVEERRTKPVPAFDAVKNEVEAYVSRKAQQDRILALRAKATIERLDAPAKPDAALRGGKGEGAEPTARPPTPK